MGPRRRARRRRRGGARPGDAGLRRVRRTFGEVRERSRGLASFLAGQGHRPAPRAVRARALGVRAGPRRPVLHNGTEYIEADARRLPGPGGAVQRQPALPAPSWAPCSTDVGPRAAVYHRRYGPLLAEAVDTTDLVLIDVDDGSGVEPLPGSTGYRGRGGDATRRPPGPSPDDLCLVCTGGTTGRPKAVLWRQADIYVSAMAGVEGATAESIGAEAEAGAMGPWYAVPPLMHAAAQWTAYSGLHRGCTVLVHDDSRPFDPGVVLALIERERAFMMSIVGDAYAPAAGRRARRPVRRQLAGHDRHRGAATSDHLKEALLDLVPDLTIVDGYGASETGGMAFGARTRRPSPRASARAWGPRWSAPTAPACSSPGDEEVGWTARRGRVPLGYLGDPEAPRPRSRSSAASGWPSPATGPSAWPTAASGCSGGTRWS